MKDTGSTRTIIFTWFQLLQSTFLLYMSFFGTAQKMKFSIKGFFSKCDQIRSFLKKSFMENFIFCVVQVQEFCIRSKTNLFLKPLLQGWVNFQIPLRVTEHCVSTWTNGIMFSFLLVFLPMATKLNDTFLEKTSGFCRNPADKDSFHVMWLCNVINLKCFQILNKQVLNSFWNN